MSLIQKPNELQFVQFIKSLIYGQPGIGKTTLGLSAPAPLVLDCDRGMHRVSPLHLKDTVPVSKWEDIDAVLNEDLSAYSTLVVDTAGKMIEFMTDFLIRQDPRLRQSDGSLSLKGYGARKVMFKNFFSRVSMLGKNLVFIAHETEERDGDTRFSRPEIGGSSGNDLMKELDLVGYMEAIGKKRTISFDATEKYYGKNACNLPERIEVSDAVKNPNTLLTTIFGQYRDMLDEKTKMRAAYNGVLDQIDSIVENANTLDAINKAVVTTRDMAHIWDSKIQGAHKVNNKAKALGFTFNKASGKYEGVINEQASFELKSPSGHVIKFKGVSETEAVEKYGNAEIPEGLTFFDFCVGQFEHEAVQINTEKKTRSRRAATTIERDAETQQ